MERYIKEYVDFTGEEKGKFDSTLNTLCNFRDELNKEIAFPTLSDLLLDTEHLIAVMESYLKKYYK